MLYNHSVVLFIRRNLLLIYVIKYKINQRYLKSIRIIYVILYDQNVSLIR